MDFGMVYQEQLPRIYRYLRARTASSDDAADLAQQVFLKALVALPTYRARGLPIEAWLFRIARNVAIDARRRQRPSISLELFTEVHDPASSDDPEAALVQADALQHLIVHIAQLNASQQELLVLRFVAELSTSEIATIVGKRQGAVRKQLQRILRKLKAYDDVQ